MTTETPVTQGTTNSLITILPSAGPSRSVFTLPVVDVDPEQAWFWTPEWQARIRAAEEDIREGRYEEFATMDDFISSLESLMNDE
jgi:hypothetical protein